MKKVLKSQKMAHKKTESMISVQTAKEQMKTLVLLVLGGNKKCIEIGHRYAEEHFDDPEAFEIFSDLSIHMLLDGVFAGWKNVEANVRDSELLQEAFAMAQELQEALGIPMDDEVAEFDNNNINN